MRIDLLLSSEENDFHVWSRHRVAIREIEYAVYANGAVFRGREENIYMVLGRTEEGRYRTVFVRYLGGCTARLITARDMTQPERRRHDRHTAH